jgi:hypothetical protein
VLHLLEARAIHAAPLGDGLLREVGVHAGRPYPIGDASAPGEELRVGRGDAWHGSTLDAS